MSERELYIGLMSGTSLDGVDAVLADLEHNSPRILAATGLPFSAELRASLFALNTAGADELNRSAEAGIHLAHLYARAVRNLLTGIPAPAADIKAIGCHGQTVRHRPDLGYTIQLGNAALLAELAGIQVVADFRSRDIAAGGQGAPLVPAFHAQMFHRDSEDRIVLNLGGIANITYLPKSGTVFGFDCGPGVCLLDHWAAVHLDRPYDTGGAWGAGGKVNQVLLNAFLQEPYFAAPHPKSTGRDLFNERWLDDRLSTSSLQPVDVQATLIELIARVVHLAARSCGPVQALIVCGGGTHNDALLGRLAQLFSPTRVETSAVHGIDPDYVEALAFAWLAKRAIEGEAGNLPAVTGARGLRVLGAVYPR